MLNFILGTAKSGKTTYMSKMIKELSSDKKVMLIVPEQFTLETERELYKLINKSDHKNIMVTSFSRLAENIFDIFGGRALNSADDSAKIVIMSLAIEQVRDMLTIYSKSSVYQSFALTMLTMVKEFKTAGVTEADLQQALGGIKSKYLHDKAKEILIIYSTYNALLAQSYDDPLDNISRASKLINSNSYFASTTVFIDEFKSFTANQNSIIRQIIKDSDNCFFSLCLDTNQASVNKNSVFACVYDTYITLKRFARELNVKTAPPIRLDGVNNFLSDELYFLEQNILRSSNNTFEGECDNLKCVLCKNEYNEIDFALASISNLVRSGRYRYNDIVIISRDLDTYINGLVSGFEKYGIPYFSDAREPITVMPIIRFIACAINSVGFNTTNILTMLKCGLFHFDIKDISELENYTFIWSINGEAWLNEWQNNPRGFFEGYTDQDLQTLERINSIRDFVVSGLLHFKESSQDKNGQQIGKVIYEMLSDFDIINNYQAIIDNLYANANIALAAKYEHAWEILIEILDTLADTLKNQTISLNKYLQYYLLIISNYDMGIIPQSLDSVSIGDAKRIRTNNPKVAFVLGAIDGIFPFVPEQNGLLSDKERATLIALNVSIAPPSFEVIKEERFIAYKTLATPTEKLYILTKKTDVSGKLVSPSIIFAQIKALFPKIKIIDTDNLTPLYYCQTQKTAFAALAEIYNDDSVEKASLLQALNKSDKYSKKLKRLEDFCDKSDFNLTNVENTKKLFGSELNISPTRVEGFYQCQFKYFCEHGLRISSIRKAELNPLEKGSLIHAVLESVAKQIDLSQFIDVDVVKTLINNELDRYIVNIMGGKEDKSGRFLFLYNKTAEALLKIIQHINVELMQSEFKPCDYELSISSDSDVTPLTLQTDDGHKINIVGKIDRVDIYTDKSGQKFVRVVDYKSGSKKFKLNDVYYGLNLQMLLYLFCICKNSKERYKNALPAGILYMPANEAQDVLERAAGEKEIEKAKLAYYKMNGLLLKDSDVLKAMDKEINGVFIPVQTKMNGDFNKASLDSLISLSELGIIGEYINHCVIDMASGLLGGKIKADPLPEVCEYCDYSSICATRKSDARKKKYCNFSKDDAFALIKKSVKKEETSCGKD